VADVTGPPITIVEYVCPAKYHRVATVIAGPDGRVVRVRRLALGEPGPRKDVRTTNNGKSPDLPLDEGDLPGWPDPAGGGDAVWIVRAACGCGQTFILAQSRIRDDVAAHRRRVVLFPDQ